MNKRPQTAPSKRSAAGMKAMDVICSDLSHLASQLTSITAELEATLTKKKFATEKQSAINRECMVLQIQAQALRQSHDKLHTERKAIVARADALHQESIVLAGSLKHVSAELQDIKLRRDTLRLEASKLEIEATHEASTADQVGSLRAKIQKELSLQQRERERLAKEHKAALMVSKQLKERIESLLNSNAAMLDTVRARVSAASNK